MLRSTHMKWSLPEAVTVASAVSGNTRAPRFETRPTERQYRRSVDGLTLRSASNGAVQNRSIRTAKPRARIPALCCLEIPVTAADNVSQPLRFAVQHRIQIPRGGPGGLIDTSDQPSPQGCDGACTADDGIGAVNSHVVSRVWIGIAGHIGYAAFCQGDGCAVTMRRRLAR